MKTKPNINEIGENRKTGSGQKKPELVKSL